LTVILTSNGAPIPYTPHYFGALQASDPATDAAALRARYDADGYVFLKNAVSAEMVLKLREAYLTQFAAGFCKDDDTRRGAFSGQIPQGPGHGHPGHPAHGFVRSAAFHAFADQPVFKALAETFFDAPATRIRRTPLRHFIPGRKVASRAHTDRTYIEGVAADIVTIWVPLGDSPLVSGGLLYLENSHRDGALEDNVRARQARGEAPMDRSHDTRPLTHDLKWIADATGHRWLSADYAAGDVVIHSPAIVHASTDPGDTDYMRISTDLRFRRADSPADPRWSSDWSADDGY
jgi:ectoine hydroxylase-related dioxygenase (phytanoyl-CoA dioxygenase family)